MTEAILGLLALLGLSFLRVPIAISMGLVGFLGVWWMRGIGPSMASATTVVYESGFQYALSVVPLFAGYDLDAEDPSRAARIFSFDVTGGPYEERGFEAIGSGAVFANSALKKRYRPGLSLDEAVRLAVEALYDAAEDDSATGGPDLVRRIFPVVAVITDEGYRRLSDDEVSQVAQQVHDGRRGRPNGPQAPVL